MKTITIHISDRVIDELKTMIGIKHISGNLFGIQDEFIIKLVEAIEDNKEEVTLKYKDEE